MDNSRLPYLLRQQSAGALTSEEWSELEAMVSNVEDEALQAQLVELLRQHEAEPVELNGALMEATFARVVSTDKQQAEATAVGPMHRVHFLKTAWFRYAAAIIILFGAGAYLYITNQKEKPFVTTTPNALPVQNDVAPGGNRATLTLADGRKIVLDDANTGTIAKEGNTVIDKAEDGQIIYRGSATGLPLHTAINTMSTPRGGQYRLVLPDGSRVWLNAESSITYPAAFTGKTREVKITGEAYFEVTSDKNRPFRVACDLAGHPERGEGSMARTMTIEVLGTHFNVNTYNDEIANNTTLLEGSVRIKTEHTSLTLKPGQQGQLRGNRLSLASNPDVEQAVAWKNGVFNFNNVDLQTAMRQLSRWYDVEVVYEGKVPEKTFDGRMGRDLNLSQVLKVLNGLGVKIRMEGKKLIVTA